MRSWRNCIAILCLAMLCVGALTLSAHLFCAIVLPVCFAFSLAVTIAAIVDAKRQPSPPDFSLPLPARAPPA